MNATDTPTKPWTDPNPFTEEELLEASKQMRSDAMSTIDPFDTLDPVDLIYPWVTGCWSCGHTQWVWLVNGVFSLDHGNPTITADTTAAIRRQPGGSLQSIARIGRVTTKAGGTYYGFTCNACESVLGRHFLKLEAARQILDGTIVKWFI